MSKFVTLNHGSGGKLSHELIREVFISRFGMNDPVTGLCEVLGFDPLYLANEGKVLIVAGDEEHRRVLEIMRSSPEGEKSAIIGEVVQDKRSLVILNTPSGGKRIIDMPTGMQLPRIC